MIKSILHAAEILSCFTEDKTTLSLTEISRLTKMNKSTVYQILATLVEIKFIRKTDNNLYALGLKFFLLGSLVLSRMELGSIPMPVLKHLGAIFEETVHLAMIDGTEAAYTLKIEANRSIRMSTNIGQRIPLYCTGIGKVLLSYNEHLLPLVIENGLKPRTKNTITTEKALKEEINTIKKSGYALDQEELEEGLISVAASIRDYSGEVIAAISVAGPSERMRSRINRIITEILSASNKISEEMGYMPLSKLNIKNR